MTAAKMVLYDWQRGKIPFFVPPPQLKETTSEEPGVARDEGDGKMDTGTPEEKEKSSAAMKAIADVISSQQLEDVPVQSDLYSENELKGESVDRVPTGEQ